MDRYPAEFRSEQVLIKNKSRYRLSQRERLHTLNGVRYETFYILEAMCVRFLSFELWRYEAGYSVPKMVRQINCLRTSAENYTVTRCHIEEEGVLHAFVYETRILAHFIVNRTNLMFKSLYDVDILTTIFRTCIKSVWNILMVNCISNSYIWNTCVTCQYTYYELPEDNTIMSKHVGVW